MHFLQPTTWDDALEARAGLPDALPVAGGTDVLVDLNFRRRHAPALIDSAVFPAWARCPRKTVG